MTHTFTAPRADTPASPAIRRAGWLLAVLAVPGFGLVALALGKEAGWDFQNYHWYNPYAFLAGRIGFDIAVAHHATYYNPLIDVPLFWLGTHFPAWVAGLWLGAQAGIGAALIGAVAYRLLPFEDGRIRLGVAALLALAGMGGGAAFGEIGMTSDDIASGLGVLAALLVLVMSFPRVLHARRGDLAVILLPAGFLAGISPGLKLTAMPYLVGLAVALLFLPGTAWRRFLRVSAFGVGALIGIGLFGGFWYWTMWRFSGNPVFPYFSAIFPTTLVPPGDYRDANFLPTDWITRGLFPFIFSLNPLKVGETQFRDFHIAIAYVLVPLAGLLQATGWKPWKRLVDPLAARMLLSMAAATYVVWLFLFGIYRYLVPLEMLSPLVIAVAVALLPMGRNVRIGAVILLLVAAQIAARPYENIRKGWGGHYVEIDVPPLPDPAHSLILLTGTQPTAFMIPEFPPEVAFLRIQGWLVGTKDRQWGLGADMHRRVEQNQGPLYVLFRPEERAGTIDGLADYGTAIDEPTCRPVPTNIDGLGGFTTPSTFCQLTRIAQ